MADNYRQCLGDIKPNHTTHHGLWLDKYMSNHKTGSGQELVAQTAKIQVPEAYRSFYDRWKAALAQNAAIVTKTASVRGRLSIGLGGESVLETAITLHRTYGVPYIPGSALKGLAASYARNKLDPATWGIHSNAYTTMFGSTDSAGYLTFFDALYVPGTGHENKPLWPDVITVHHPAYYQGDAAPADWDSPTPISFLSATGDYLLAIGGDPDWIDKAFGILAFALAEEGIGAKTSSGYGRMSIAGMTDVAPLNPANGQPPSTDPKDAVVEQYMLAIDQMAIKDVASKLPAVAQRWHEEELSSANKLLVARAILEKVEAAGRAKQSRGKPWFEELWRYVEKAESL